MTAELFRFNDHYEDVFIEDGKYLYVCDEPYGWPYLFACNPYAVITDAFGYESLLRYDAAGADYEYLKTLEYAPVDIAEWIIEAEYQRAESLYPYEYDETDEEVA